MVRWNGYRIAALLALAGAVAVGAYGMQTGELNVALLFIIPVFYGTGLLGVLAVLLVFAAFILWAVGTMRAFTDTAREHGGEWATVRPTDPYAGGERARAPEESERPRKRFRGGGVIMLGPIPIVMGTDKRTTFILIGLTLVLMLLALLVIAVSPRL